MRWAEIAKFVPGRTDLMCRSQWKRLERRRIREVKAQLVIEKGPEYVQSLVAMQQSVSGARVDFLPMRSLASSATSTWSSQGSGYSSPVGDQVSTTTSMCVAQLQAQQKQQQQQQQQQQLLQDQEVYALHQALMFTLQQKQQQQQQYASALPGLPPLLGPSTFPTSTSSSMGAPPPGDLLSAWASLFPGTPHPPSLGSFLSGEKDLMSGWPAGVSTLDPSSFASAFMHGYQQGSVHTTASPYSPAASSTRILPHSPFAVASATDLPSTGALPPPQQQPRSSVCSSGSPFVPGPASTSSVSSDVSTGSGAGILPVPPQSSIFGAHSQVTMMPAPGPFLRNPVPYPQWGYLQADGRTLPFPALQPQRNAAAGLLSSAHLSTLPELSVKTASEKDSDGVLSRGSEKGGEVDSRDSDEEVHLPSFQEMIRGCP